MSAEHCNLFEAIRQRKESVAGTILLKNRLSLANDVDGSVPVMTEKGARDEAESAIVLAFNGAARELSIRNKYAASTVAFVSAAGFALGLFGYVDKTASFIAAHALIAGAAALFWRSRSLSTLPYEQYDAYAKSLDYNARSDRDVYNKALDKLDAQKAQMNIPVDSVAKLYSKVPTNPAPQ